MKLESFKFQDGKVFWLPEYPERRPIFRNFSAETSDKLHYEDELNAYDEAIVHSLASAIEVAPEEIIIIKRLIVESVYKNGRVGDATKVITSMWQPENGKVYSAECEMEIIHQVLIQKTWHQTTKESYDKWSSNGTEPHYRQVARLKLTKEHLPKRDTSSRDWTEDFDDENGNYQNKCCRCKLLFYGNKHRVICKECDAAANSHDMKDEENQSTK